MQNTRRDTKSLGTVYLLADVSTRPSRVVPHAEVDLERDIRLITCKCPTSPQHCKLFACRRVARYKTHNSHLFGYGLQSMPTLRAPLVLSVTSSSAHPSVRAVPMMSTLFTLDAPALRAAGRRCHERHPFPTVRRPAWLAGCAACAGQPGWRAVPPLRDQPGWSRSPDTTAAESLALCGLAFKEGRTQLAPLS